MSEVSVKVSGSDSEKDDINFKPPHNGEPITKIEISPEEKYLVTYSPSDHSIFCWCIAKGELELDNYRYDVPFIETNDSELYNKMEKMCVSDDKKLAYVYKKDCSNYLEIIDMNNNNKGIKLDLDHDEIEGSYSEFCSDDSGKHMNMIWIYSTQTKNNKWTCKRMYEIPEDFKFISVSKYSKIYLLFSNNYIYEWNLLTEKITSMFCSYEEVIKPGLIRISSNEKFVCLIIEDKIIIYSIELNIPIITLQTGEVEIQEKDKEQTNVQTSGFISLLDILHPLLNNKIYDSIMAYYHEDCRTESLSKIAQDTKSIEYIIGNLNGSILDGHILNIRFKVLVDKLEHLNVHSFSLYADDINDENLQEMLIECLVGNPTDLYFGDKNEDNKFSVNCDKWEINWSTAGEIEIWFLNNDESRIIRVQDFIHSARMRHTLFKNNDILFVSHCSSLVYVSIYHFNENSNKISLSHFHCSEAEGFSISPLLLQNDNSFKNCDEWISDIINNKESLLKYGVELFSFAIRERNFKLIDEIYKKCILYFNEDLRNNKTFLGIISITMPLLNEHYPEFILKYSLETNMITDSQFYNIDDKKKNLHLYSNNPQIIDLTRSILWFKYNIIMSDVFNDTFCDLLFLFIMFLTLPILPILFFIIYLSLKYHFIDDIKFKRTLAGRFVQLYFDVAEKFEKFSKYISTSTITPTIIFMIPYIKFVNYPKDYNWFLELIKPQPSPFIETINENIYKTWNGEALINFKWNAYGKYYYAVIWISFMVLLGCFTVAATVPQQYIDKNIQNQLFITSIILGFIHLSFETRQFIYSPKKWIRDFWNIFGM
ncbi:hypothetical protein RhiirB3_390471 [Rhizophagus irregularis]|nr:hypothetical protein RhiirB3_390471 [Rhizophagus irregularis]